MMAIDTKEPAQVYSKCRRCGALFAGDSCAECLKRVKRYKPLIAAVLGLLMATAALLIAFYSQFIELNRQKSREAQIMYDHQAETASFQAEISSLLSEIMVYEEKFGKFVDFVLIFDDGTSKFHNLGCKNTNNYKVLMICDTKVANELSYDSCASCCADIND